MTITTTLVAAAEIKAAVEVVVEITTASSVAEDAAVVVENMAVAATAEATAGMPTTSVVAKENTDPGLSLDSPISISSVTVEPIRLIILTPPYLMSKMCVNLR
jgi:hypothetical protein